MKKFLSKTALFLLPCLLFVAAITLLYIKQDPYNDFNTDPHYPWKYRFQQRGDLSTKLLLSSNRKYNSFVFGSSRSCSVYCCYLEKKIPGSAFFHYSNWSETIGGIYAKLHLLDSMGYAIDNAVIYIDPDRSFDSNGDVRISDHYLLTGQNRFEYYSGHFKTFFSSPDQNKIRILFGSTGEGDLFTNQICDTITNDLGHYCSDNVIESYGNPDTTAARRLQIQKLIDNGFFYKRADSQEYLPKLISGGEEEYIRKIEGILSKHHTRFYVVITPIYNQRKLAVADMAVLQKYFGKNLYDFSGINHITGDVFNFKPDRIHFQPCISKNILDSIIR